MRFAERARGKINLHLKVFERRADGYHRVETSLLRVGWYDEIEAEVEVGDGLEVEVENVSDLSGPHNLVWRAADLFLREGGLHRKVGVKIRKNLPLGAGLGGGSSDAAAMLQILQKATDRFSQDELLAMGASLGADVPFFLGQSSFGLARGRGDEIEGFLAPPSRSVLLIYPNFPVSTAEAYQALRRPLTCQRSDGTSPPFPKSAKTWLDLEVLRSQGNDFQPVVEAIHPELAEIRQRLVDRGAGWAQLSGSGSTVFGLFDQEGAAEAAAQGWPSSWKVFLTKTEESG